jgi:hypothetical protein
MIRTAKYTVLQAAIKDLCANWTYFNHPYKTAEAAQDKGLLDLRPKQAYLQSLDHPDYPTEVILAEATDYDKEVEGPDPTLADR